jgi:alkylation response protein AidB-like acyl-CoA dehydrogenase
VAADEVLPVPAERPSPLAQVYLTAVLAGIAAACARDAVGLVNARSRNYFHGLHVEPRHDPVLQTTVGRLSADAYAARAIVLEAARSLGTDRAPLDAARAKVVVDELVTRSASGLLDAGSASAVRSGLALDRHWRNARTVIAHNPGSYKLRALGDHALNGTPAPKGSYF